MTFLVQYVVNDSEHSPDWHSMELEADSREEAEQLFRDLSIEFFDLQIDPL